MKLKEGVTQYEIDLPKMKVDKTFVVYDPKKKSYVKADYIKKTGLPSTSGFCLGFVGNCGSGKTSLLVSLLCSKKSKCYRGCFDTILFCCSETSIRSIGGDPFKSIPSDQFYDEFNLEFINEVKTITEHESENGRDTLIIVDDACQRLRSDKRLNDTLLNELNVRRHKLASWIFLCQDVMQLNPAMRATMDGLLIWKCPNDKRELVIKDEYLSMDMVEFREFVKFVWRKHGDCLYIKLKKPTEFYRNFKLIEMTKDDEGDCNCNTESV